MGKFFCKFFGWHTPDRSLNVYLKCHCKYCRKDITKINGHWRTEAWQ